MRKNFGAKPYIYPQPVFIIGSYDENGVADAMNAAWGSIADYETIALYLSAGHKTVKNILNKKAFKTKWHISKSETIDAPIFEELPMTLECQLESYDEKTHLLLGKIINVSADERILDENDEIDPTKLKPIIFDAVHNTYLKIGKQVGHAFKDGQILK